MSNPRQTLLVAMAELSAALEGGDVVDARDYAQRLKHVINAASAARAEANAPEHPQAQPSANLLRLRRRQQ